MRKPKACWAAYRASAVFPTPASPLMTKTALWPPRTLASSRSSTWRSLVRPRNPCERWAAIVLSLDEVDLVLHLSAPVSTSAVASSAMHEPPIRWSTYPNAYERTLAGRLERHEMVSRLLADNPLGDPAERPVEVYVPPGYDDDPQRRYPSVYVIQGLTGQLDMWRNRTAFRKNFPELADELFARGASPPAILVWVDAWTSLGGSQFIDSPGTGRYHTHIVEELVPFVDARYRTMPEAAHRG